MSMDLYKSAATVDLAETFGGRLSPFAKPLLLHVAALADETGMVVFKRAPPHPRLAGYTVGLTEISCAMEVGVGALDDGLDDLLDINVIDVAQAADDCTAEWRINLPLLLEGDA